VSGASRIEACRIIELPKIHDPRGNLTFIEGERHVPFEIKRVYYLYDVPGGESRAGHAHRTLEQVLIALAGSFDVSLDDGTKKRRFHMYRAHLGVYVPRLLWRELDNFSSGAICLALASAPYDEADYLRSYVEFLTAVRTAR
jgi:hypothetical protein